MSCKEGTSADSELYVPKNHLVAHGPRGISSVLCWKSNYPFNKSFWGCFSALTSLGEDNTHFQILYKIFLFVI